MRKAKQILEDLYKVYSPKELAEDPNVVNEPFNSNEIRNIMMSYFMEGTKVIRELIDKMPDEWVVEFLRNQEDTEVEKVNESAQEKPADFQCSDKVFKKLQAWVKPEFLNDYKDWDDESILDMIKQENRLARKQH